ncbi:MAG: hypothetical protein HC771_22675 [Synechococcales cyanobacterium CRU_2_2]|nr:hypothetical protein [Synechococcales cyanobacterium CRU_2_2]
MAKKAELLNGWVATLSDLGVSVPPDALEAYFKSHKIGPTGVNEEVLLNHAEAIRLHAATTLATTEGSPAMSAGGLIDSIEEQSVQVRALSEGLKPWVEQRAVQDAGTLAAVLTSYGPLVMDLVQKRLAADPFGAQLANFRGQLAEQLAGSSVHGPSLPAPSEG